MLLENELVEIKWERRNKPIFVEKGYLFTSVGDKFLVKQKDLSPSSRVVVKIECDYCGKHYENTMIEYLRSINRNPTFFKTSCEDCQKYKIEELNILRYGVKTNLMLDSTKKQIKKTNLEKYGVENPAQNKIVQEKMKTTMLERYGVEYSGQSEEIREKQVKTNLEKYGVEYTLMNEEVKQKSRESLFKNNKAPTSRTQKYLCKLLNGKLNYPVGNFSVDIVLDNQIAFEYDGGGHDLQVKFGNISRENFIKKERNREYFLKRRGYKIIRLVSTRDKLPKENILIDLISKCIGYINNGGTNAEINIDNQYIRFGKEIIDQNFGELFRTDKAYFDRIEAANAI